jgi:hypothetical protein
VKKIQVQGRYKFETPRDLHIAEEHLADAIEELLARLVSSRIA